MGNTEVRRICGGGLSCEAICPVRSPGRVCALSLMQFAELLDCADIASTGFSDGVDVDLRARLAPEGGEVSVPVLVV